MHLISQFCSKLLWEDVVTISVVLFESRSVEKEKTEEKKGKKKTREKERKGNRVSVREKEKKTSDAGSQYRCGRVGRGIQPPASP